MDFKVLLAALCLGPLAGATAQAGLGDGLARVLEDAAAMGGLAQASFQGAFSVQDITVPSGLHVREYLDPAGAVFAVTWSGPVVPDLQQLLSGYYSEYSAALAKLSPAELRRSGNVALQDLVVQSSGHLRAYAGRAYLPARLPAGVSPAQIP